MSRAVTRDAAFSRARRKFAARSIPSISRRHIEIKWTMSVKSIPRDERPLFNLPAPRTAYPWAPSPQSQGPSPPGGQPTPTGSKPASVAMPSLDFKQLPTPDQSTVPVMATEPADDTTSSPTGCGRGRRLTPQEELCLVRLCMLQMENYDVTEYPKSFWIKISELFFVECGRTYSWQSCRRRIATYVRNYQEYLDWLTNGKGDHPPIHIPQNEVFRQVEEWIVGCNAREKAAQHRLEIEKARVAAEEERQRLEEERQRLEVAHRELQRAYTQKRIRDWVTNNPQPAEMEPLFLYWGETRSASNARYRSSRSRSRSRSPHRCYYFCYRCCRCHRCPLSYAYLPGSTSLGRTFSNRPPYHHIKPDCLEGDYNDST
ncbi:hypothetical protein ASPZODRAFT_1184708 [Penicilliopsis zonata CBS 506.65]|uniref:Uncharacterized protein n=1 Tax=Penicilliopsis zonata CBS 506.65 TaxID=1073090 RepID=A0A1L9S7X7_9EURO|nr:hypothetical protein ASPZODRAFT_1184708 [Penicilliopsis zonata CBS 506.65]OJJ43250.1 hypothetical protein ASPZODRAFT_1184708 [Penicilliopsis zonata CBS 506.65]